MMRETKEKQYEVWIVDETDCFRLGFIKKMERRYGAPPQTWEQYSREGRVWDLRIANI